MLTNTAATLNTGHYFLQGDVEATKQLVILDNANVTICLNGHKWTGFETVEAGNTEPAIKLGTNATLTIMDDSADQTGTVSVYRLTQVPAGATLNLNAATGVQVCMVLPPLPAAPLIWSAVQYDIHMFRILLIVLH